MTSVVRASGNHDVLLMKHGRPAAVPMSTRRHAELMAQLDDLEDRLSVHEREGLTMDHDKLRAELDLDKD